MFLHVTKMLCDAAIRCFTYLAEKLQSHMPLIRRCPPQVRMRMAQVRNPIFESLPRFVLDGYTGKQAHGFRDISGKDVVRPKGFEPLT